MGDYQYQRNKMLVRCNACKGQKRVLCLGFIEGDCAVCSGTGFVSVEEAVKQPTIRRARKSKVEPEADTQMTDDENNQTSSQISEPSSSK